MALRPFSVMTRNYTLIERTPTKWITVKQQPFSPGDYVITLWSPLSQHISAFMSQSKTCCHLQEGGRKGLWANISRLPSERDVLLPFPRSLWMIRGRQLSCTRIMQTFGGFTLPLFCCGFTQMNLWERRENPWLQVLFLTFIQRLQYRMCLVLAWVIPYLWIYLDPRHL